MKYFYLAIILFFLAVFICISQVQALTVSPPRIEVFAKAGQVFEGKFLLSNEQLETKTFYSSFENFEATGEEGTPTFTLGTEGLATWIEAPGQVILKPGEQKKISYKIRVPANAEDGGYFAAIFWGTSPPQPYAGSQVTVGAKLGILVLLRVGENVKEGGGLLEFSTKDNKRFFTTLPISFTYRFSNDGGDRIKPEGEIKVKNTIGLTAASLPANPTDGNILPGSIRKFTTIWQSKSEAGSNKGFFKIAKKQWGDFTFGIYKAKLSLEYGRKQIETVKDSYFFFVFPWQLLSLVLVVVLAAGFILKTGLKKYNQWIISKVQGQKK